jgi:hypothetical protein
MKARWSSPRGQTTSRNPDFALFVLIFLIFFLILYHLNRKRTIFQLNWIEGVAYGNSIIFGAKFKPPSSLWVRCIGTWIWASSDGQTWLGRHNISQRKKQHNTISMKAQRTSPRGQATIFLIFFLILYQLRNHTSSQVNLIKGVAYRNSTILAWNLKHHLGSKLGALEVEFEPLPVGKTDKEGTTDHEERKTQHDQHESSTEPATGSWHLLKSKFYTFYSYFCDIFLILYHIRKHNNF